jgi:hypothetical protein
VTWGLAQAMLEQCPFAIDTKMARVVSKFLFGVADKVARSQCGAALVGVENQHSVPDASGTAVELKRINSVLN